MTQESEQGKAARYLAHVRRDGETSIPHDLREHLLGVGQRAEEYARAFGSADWAKVAGIWHDLGKYSTEFQKRIKSLSGYGYDAETADLEGRVGRVDHSTAGAQYAIQRFGRYGRILTYLIAGHHAGLPDWHTSDTRGAATGSRTKSSVRRSSNGTAGGSSPSSTGRDARLPGSSSASSPRRNRSDPPPIPSPSGRGLG